MPRFVELSHPLKDGMRVYPGLPTPRIGAHLDHEQSKSHYDDKATFFLGKVAMVCNIGTYLDAPFHRFPEGADLAQFPLASIAGVPGVVVGISSQKIGRIAPEDLQTDWRLEGLAVLIRTGWDRRWGTDGYWLPGPFLTEDTAEKLVESKASLIGVDFWNIDDPKDNFRPAHTNLLRANIPIVEHLANLDELPTKGFKFYAVPPMITHGASFPVRAFAEFE